VILLLIVSSHAPLDALCAVPLQDFRFFSILLRDTKRLLGFRTGLFRLFARITAVGSYLGIVRRRLWETILRGHVTDESTLP
jgi:hypothetical protein